ncbi:MAG TPA: hypothetical protein VLH79_01515 [Chthonomonadales bacterium]|nr:hypothetical protein [Chthonomonadales bacterium]
MTSPIAGVYARALVVERAVVARVTTAPSNAGPASGHPSVSVEISSAARGPSVAAAVREARETARMAGDQVGPAVSHAARIANGSLTEPKQVAARPSLDLLA